MASRLYGKGRSRMSPFILRCEIDKVEKDCWHNVINQFDDASLDQTWPSGELGGRKRSVSHIVLKDGEEILGCSQVSVLRLPLLGLGIANINWGPLYLKKGRRFDEELMGELVRAIKYEYAVKRGYLIRMSPRATGDQKIAIERILVEQGFKRCFSERPYKTFMLDLSPALEDLRKNLSQNWRRNLNKAQKAGLSVEEGSNGELFEIYAALSREMWQRKKVRAKIDNEKYRRIQEELPESLKMNIMVCKFDHEPVCAVVCSAIGDTGIYLLGASGEKALKLNASYLLHWRMIEWLKEKGVRYYDLGAHNAHRNPGGYQFKMGIAGKSGWEEVFIGEFHGCFNVTGLMAKVILRCWESVKEIQQTTSVRNRDHQSD
jgi:lipid II:glycine glycyltransferase (peptidoglycan interpeptide bridge formation enzyme)